MTEFVRPERGQPVFVCFPHDAVRLAWDRGYIGGGPCPDGSEIGLKPVVAVSGDLVQMSGDGISVNGQLIPGSQALPHDTSNRPMRSMAAGVYPVGDNEVWIISSQNRLSYDSRYFGPVLVQNIKGEAQPVLVEP